MRALVTARFTLEPLVHAHADEMFEVLSDPALYEFENAPPASVEQLAERYARLESRSSLDGTEMWLNWVLRLAGGPDVGRLAGYVQATILPSDDCFIAYELSSRYWRQGLGSAAVSAMLAELQAHYDVQRFVAVLKAANFRSLGLLRHLGFVPADAAEAALYRSSTEEIVMVRPAKTPVST